MGSRSANTDNRGSAPPKGAAQDFSMRGNANGPKNWWFALMPNARKKVVEQGLFTADGTITEKGLKMLVAVNGIGIK